jgi:hypothetical protein
MLLPYRNVHMILLLELLGSVCLLIVWSNMYSLRSIIIVVVLVENYAMDGVLVSAFFTN